MCIVELYVTVDDIKKLTYNFHLVMKLPDHVYVFVKTYSLSFTPPLATISFRAHTYVYVARVRVMLNASRRFLTIACMT
jgi:hypothetical protein